MANLGINAGVSIGGIGQPLQYPTINGVSYSWASIEFKFAGAPIVTVQNIDYKITRERKVTYGTNVNPLRKTRGRITYEAKAKILLPELNGLLQALGEQDPTGNNAYGDVFFGTTITYTENGFATITDSILYCTIDSVEQSTSEGVDEVAVEINLNPLLILRNGQPMSSIPLSAPQF
jgi:hypothetical protein